jgi:hypothetical protein
MVCSTLNPAHKTFQVKLLYKGTLRVLLVLLHDFPEFLCECVSLSKKTIDMGRWAYGWMDTLMDGQTDRWIHGWVDKDSMYW